MNEQNNNIVLLVLCRKVIGGSLAESIEKRPRMKAFAVYDYQNAEIEAAAHKPDIALVEIPERHGTPALDTLVVCQNIRCASPGCKIILLCPENDEASVRVCVEAKQREKIDDYVFYDSTTAYLVSKLESLLSEEPLAVNESSDEIADGTAKNAGLNQTGVKKTE